MIHSESIPIKYLKQAQGTHARALASALNFVRQKACRNVAIEQNKNIVNNQ
jgi:hypothetical protein